MLPRLRSSQAGAAIARSGIEGLPVYRVERLAHGFVNSGMRVNGIPQRFDSCFGFHGQNAFTDQLISFWTNDMDAQNLAVLRVGNNLDEPVMLTQDTGFAVRRKW